MRWRRRRPLPTSGAEADRGHHPHRRPRSRRRGHGRGRRTVRRWSACCAQRATPAGPRSARTPDLLPVLKDAGVVDAGGAGFLLLLDSALHVVDGEPLPEPSRRRRSVARSSSRPSLVARRQTAGSTCQRTALRGDVLPRPRRRVDRRLQAGVGCDRRLDRRRRWRRPVELPRAHQRHRRGDRGGARSRRPAAPDPGHRPVRGGRRRARPPRGGDGRRLVAVRRAVDRVATRHVRGRRGRQRRRVWSSCSATSACRASSPAGRRSTRRPPSCSPPSRRSTPTRWWSCRTTRTSSRSPSSSTR